MQKKLNITVMLLCFISVQYILLECFERYYYKIESYFTKQEIKSAVSEKDQGQENNLYDYDAYGFRTYHIDYENKKGFRVLLVGGNSIAMGYGVPIEQSFPYYLQKKLEAMYPEKSIEIINACLPGNPLPRNMALLKNIFFDKIKPDLVLYTSYLYETDLFFSGGNELTTESIFSHNTDIFNMPQGDNADTASFKIFRIDQTKMGKQLVDHSLMAAKLIAYLDLNLGKKQNKIKSKMLKDKIHPFVSGYIQELNHYLTDHHIKFMIVELPRSKKNQLSSEIRAVSHLQKIPYLSLKEIWDESKLNYVENGHYAPDTNKLVGEEIAEWVSKARISPG